jgi:peroxiredoxin
VPAFTLPDLAGNPVRLEDFRGQRVLLVHWSPNCGFCDRIAEELGELDAALRAHKVRIVLLANGDGDRNRQLAEQHALTLPILLLAGGAPVAREVFENQGTPVAYLLDADGKVAAPLAIGADRVPALARQLLEEGGAKQRFGTRSLHGSHILRDGLSAGTQAPDFTLPDVAGRGDVALDAYRGRKVLLVFSDPDCGPCQDLAPRLAELHRAHEGNGLAVIMVGRGDVEANRRKVEEHGFGFPVVAQRKWELSRAYGIFATPVGFLIDERGVIARDVAKGANAILELVPGAGVAGRGGGDA